MMEADEEGTASRLAELTALVGEKVEGREGRVFKTMGEAVLAEFASPLNALRCAVELRGALAEMSSSLQMRFGLHLADVIESGDDLIGDGVNLAARIQAAAAPGAIEISGTLFEQVRRHSPFTFDSLGEQKFKNISGGHPRLPAARRSGTMGLPGRAHRSFPPHRSKRPFSIAVVPPSHLSGEEVRFLADGLTEDTRAILGRLFAGPRSARAVLGKSDTDPDALGVRYVHRALREERIARPSINLRSRRRARAGSLNRIERPFETLLDTVDEIVAQIAVTVIGRLEEAEIVAARRQRPESMSAYECHLRGLEFHRLGGVTDENLREAVKWFDRAIEADPNFGRSYAMKVCAVSGLPDFAWEEGERILHRSLKLDLNDPEANRVMGSIQMQKGDFEASRKYHEKAMELSPNDAYIKGRSAAFYTFFGMPERALELLDEAEALDPSSRLVCRGTRDRVLRTGTLSRSDRTFVRAALSRAPLPSVSNRRAHGVG